MQKIFWTDPPIFLTGPLVTMDIGLLMRGLPFGLPQILASGWEKAEVKYGDDEGAKGSIPFMVKFTTPEGEDIIRGWFLPAYAFWPAGALRQQGQLFSNLEKKVFGKSK